MTAKKLSLSVKLGALDKNGNGNGHPRTIAVVGLGYVGLPLALLADKKGYQVIGFDIDEEKIKKLSKGEPVFVDEKVASLLKNSGMKATSKATALREAELVIICVPTPVYKNHIPDLRPLIGAAEAVGRNLRKGQNIILESTVNPGVSETVVLPLLRHYSGLNDKIDFHFSYCPERINPGDKDWDIENIPRVLGSLDSKGLETALAFYSSIINAEIKPMANIKEAEAVKIVENSFRDINIAFVNELALSFSRLGIDIKNVIEGASTKPFGFMAHYPGCGVGGHCIPVDPYYLIEYARKNGFDHRFLSLARQINNEMPIHTADLATSYLTDAGLPVKGSRIAVLGLSYKADIDDCRESPSFKIISHLKKQGVKVSVYDPFVPEKSTAKTLRDALTGAQIILVATAHSDFKKYLVPSVLNKLGILAVVDGRNCLDLDSFVSSGMTYLGIGRGFVPQNFSKYSMISKENLVTEI
jgi:nucleotide sugar dehydrogenase